MIRTRWHPPKVHWGSTAQSMPSLSFEANRQRASQLMSSKNDCTSSRYSLCSSYIFKTFHLYPWYLRTSGITEAARLEASRVDSDGLSGGMSCNNRVLLWTFEMNRYTAGARGYIRKATVLSPFFDDSLMQVSAWHANIFQVYYEFMDESTAFSPPTSAKRVD